MAFPEFLLEASPGSRQGQTFVGPGRDAIENRGQRKVHIRLGTEQGRKAGVKFQGADVGFLNVGTQITAILERLRSAYAGRLPELGI